MLEARNIRLVSALGIRLGRGEAEAICLAVEKEADVVALDDRTARSEALRLGLQVKGTLGIIKRLMELGKFERNLLELLDDLKRMNFRVRENLFWEIFRGMEQRQSS